MHTKLTDARNKIGLTQVEIAKKANITVRAYQNYEAGERIPKADVAVRIARAVKSTVEKLGYPIFTVENRDLRN